MASSRWHQLAQLLRAAPNKHPSLQTATRPMSSGRRDFFQRLNEQHLAHQLEGLSVSAHSVDTADSTQRALFDPKIRARPTRRLTPTLAHGASAEEAEALSAAELRAGGRDTAGADFNKTWRRKPWLNYESLRGETYPAGNKTGPRWQDLTHSEAQRLQEMYMRKRMLDRKVLWMKMQDLPNPQKEAKMTLRRQKKKEEEDAADPDFGTMYPPPFMDAHPGSPRLTKMEEQARQEELESRFRSRIRQQKLENARIVKQPAPKVGDLITDPIERHVERRLVRQRSKIHVGLEQFMTANSSQILHEHLQGATVSLVKVFAKRPRATQQVYYNLTSDHDPAFVQRQLDSLAPKLRSQFALKVNMGQTPNFRFVPFVNARDVRRKGLWGIARRLQQTIPPGGLAAKAAQRAAEGRSASLPVNGEVAL